jgi:MFS transporter, CP family, cyanate transporter
MNATRQRAAAGAFVLVGLLLVATNLRAGITTVGPVLDDIKADLGLSSVAASALISLPLLAFALVSPFTPPLVRRIGLERALALALAVLATGLVTRSLPVPGLLWVGTALLGVGIAALNVALPALVKRDFPDRIGPVTGAYSVLQSLFAALAAGLAVPIANATSAGWRLPLAMWALLAIVAIGALLPQLRRRTVVPQDQEDADLPDALHDDQGHRAMWRHPLAWQVTAWMGLQSVTYYVLITWLPSIETSAGVSEGAAGIHQTLLNAFAIAGSITCSTAITRLRDQRAPAVGAAALFAITVIGIMAAPRLSAIWSCIGGFAGGTSIVLALSFFGLRTQNHRDAAALSGMAQCVGYLIAAAGPLAIGALHDATGSWNTALITLLGVNAAMACAGLLAGRARTID